MTDALTEWKPTRADLKRVLREQHTVASISPRFADWWASWAPVVLAIIDA
jgi:hypothetical protein